MAKKKITLPTIYGDIESDIIYSGEIPNEEDTISLISINGSITPIATDQSISFEMDPFVDMYIDWKQNLKIEFRYRYIKTKRAQMIEDEDYYYITISENVRIPKNKEVALRVSIEATFAKILFTGKPTKEEIVDRLRLEMASHQTTFNPNADGRLPKGTLYGWGGTS